MKKVDVIGVPSDLGANIRGANIGPAAVRVAGLAEALRKLDISCSDKGDISVPVRERLSMTPSNYLVPIQELCLEVKKLCLQSHLDHALPIVLGGDHSVAIGSISASIESARLNNKTLGVVWVDAHADLNTPDSTMTGNIHGMPLAIALGQGYPELTGIFGEFLRPENVALIGIRNIDGKEKKLVRDSGIRYYSMRAIDERGIFSIMSEVLHDMGKNVDLWHLSFDIDGIDPTHAPGVSTPVSGGLSYRESHLLLELLADTEKLFSVDIVELNPICDIHQKTSALAVELIQSALGKSIV